MQIIRPPSIGLKILTRIILVVLSAISGFCMVTAEASPDGYKAVSSGAKYQCIGEYSVERLNMILTGEVAKFSSFSVTYPPAENPVRLYRVVYNTVVPEDNNRPVEVSGLVAVPVVSATVLPMISYQHGTVFSRTEVPSSPEESMETRLIVARFAGQGYIVVAADYIGKGISNEPDAWLVKEATAQACLDMLLAARAVCADLNLVPSDLFLSGWSQGSFSTSAFLNRLENVGIPVKAAAMASAPNDIYLCFNRWIQVPSELDVNWLVATASMMVNAYENYYGLPGLSTTAIKPQYWQAAHDLYNNKATWEQVEKLLPAKSKDLFQEDFINQCSSGTNRFSKQLQLNRSYNWRFKTPTHYYYGQNDEVVTPSMVKLPVEYQATLGGADAQAVFAGEKANHRGTFLFAVRDQKQWFDSLRSK
jgi:pimeloyl-ACP methyl ester carboxylesterase